MNVNLDDSATEIMVALKEEIRAKTKIKVSYSDVVRELFKRAGKGQQ